MGIGIENDSMRQFNYHGQMSNANEFDNPYDENDLEGLEREIEQVIRAGTASGGQRQHLEPGIVNMATGPHAQQNRRRTAATAVGGKRRRKIQTGAGSVASRPTNQFGQLQQVS